MKAFGHPRCLVRVAFSLVVAELRGLVRSNSQLGLQHRKSVQNLRREAPLSTFDRTLTDEMSTHTLSYEEVTPAEFASTGTGNPRFDKKNRVAIESRFAILANEETELLFAVL